MLAFEAAKGQEAAVVVQDELTVSHLWKGAKREYAFDNVFTSDTSQAQVHATVGVEWPILVARNIYSDEYSEHMQCICIFSLIVLGIDDHLGNSGRSC